MDEKIKKSISNSIELWKRVWGDSLQSAYLYGSAARGDWSSKTSDINILLLVDSGQYEKWPEAAEVVKRKLKGGFAVPLVLSENYVRSSLDVYPMEFLDIKLWHETLHGDDFFADLAIEPSDLRLQTEREVKGKWVQLRQAALESGSNTAAMRNLLAMTVPTWTSVFQALLAISGDSVPSDRIELIEKGSAVAGVDAEIFKRVYSVRHDRNALGRIGAWELLRSTLLQVDLLARYVDGWQS